MNGNDQPSTQDSRPSIEADTGLLGGGGFDAPSGQISMRAVDAAQREGERRRRLAL
jgi:hypothetical protein